MIFTLPNILPSIMKGSNPAPLVRSPAMSSSVGSCVITLNNSLCFKIKGGLCGEKQDNYRKIVTNKNCANNYFERNISLQKFNPGCILKIAM